MIRTLTSTDFQRNIGATADSVRGAGDVVVVTAHGRPQMVLMPYARFTELTGEAPVVVAEVGAEERPERRCQDCGTGLGTAYGNRVYCTSCKQTRERKSAWESQRRRRQERFANVGAQ